MRRIANILLLASLIMASVNMRAQAPQYAAQRDSLSYIYGINYGGYLWSNDFRSLLEAPFSEGINDYLKGVSEGAKTNTPEHRRYLKEDISKIEDVVKEFREKITNEEEISTQLRTRMSYLLGCNVADVMINNDLTDLDVTAIAKATMTMTNNKSDINSSDFLATLRFAPNMQNDLIKRYKASRQAVLNEENTVKGEAFLKEFADQPGAKMTLEGIAYIIVSPGRGGAKIKDYNYNMTGSYKECHLDGSVIIENTWRDHDLWDSTEGFRIAVREAGVGATVRAVVPAKDAYGERGSTKLGIQPGEYLIYEIVIQSLTAYKPEIYD